MEKSCTICDLVAHSSRLVRVRQSIAKGTLKPAEGAMSLHLANVVRTCTWVWCAGHRRLQVVQRPGSRDKHVNA
eukprot:1601167-Amphidinium_carterae.1